MGFVRVFSLLFLVSATVGCDGELVGGLSKSPRSVILGEHHNGVNCVTFSPDGKTLASAGNDGDVQLWDVASQENVRTLHWGEGINSAVFSPDGSLLATGSTEVLPKHLKRAGHPAASVATLWRVRTGERVIVLEGEPFTNPAYEVAFSPDGRTLAWGSHRAFDTRRCTIPLWEVPAGKLRLSLEGGMSFVYAVRFAPDGKTLATAGKAADEKTPMLKLWDVSTGKVKTEFKGIEGRTGSVAFSPDGKLLACSERLERPELVLEPDRAQIAFWDVNTGERVATLTGHHCSAPDLAFSHDGKLLASAGGDPFRKKAELFLWDVKTRKRIASLKGHEDCVSCVAFSPDDTLLATGSHGLKDNTVRLWYLRDRPPAKDKQDR